MLLVDTRAGSKELIAPLIDALGSANVEPTTLDFGDLAFASHPDTGLYIGIEHKTISDLVQSLQTDRLPGHQLPGLVRTYDRAYLMVEGEWRKDRSGKLLRRSGFNEWKPLLGAPPIHELKKRLLTLSTRGGLTILPAFTRADAIDWITALYRFWTDTPLTNHTSHLAIFNPDLDSALLTPTSAFVQAAAAWPGVGRKVAKVAEARFGSILRAVNALESEWAELSIDGKRFGAKRAAKLAAFFKGNNG